MVNITYYRSYNCYKWKKLITKKKFIDVFINYLIEKNNNVKFRVAKYKKKMSLIILN